MSVGLALRDQLQGMMSKARRSLKARIRAGLLSKRLALEVAAAILRNNAIATYGLKLPRHGGG